MFTKPNNYKFYEGGSTKTLLIAISYTASLVEQSIYEAGYLGAWLDLGKKKKKRLCFSISLAAGCSLFCVKGVKTHVK